MDFMWYKCLVVWPHTQRGAEGKVQSHVGGTATLQTPSEGGSSAETRPSDEGAPKTHPVSSTSQAARSSGPRGTRSSRWSGRGMESRVGQQRVTNETRHLLGRCCACQWPTALANFLFALLTAEFKMRGDCLRTFNVLSVSSQERLQSRAQAQVYRSLMSLHTSDKAF